MRGPTNIKLFDWSFSPATVWILCARSHSFPICFWRWSRVTFYWRERNWSDWVDQYFTTKTATRGLIKRYVQLIAYYSIIGSKFLKQWNLMSETAVSHFHVVASLKYSIEQIWQRIALHQKLLCNILIVCAVWHFGSKLRNHCSFLGMAIFMYCCGYLLDSHFFS